MKRSRVIAGHRRTLTRLLAHGTWFFAATLVVETAHTQDSTFELVWARGRGAGTCETSEVIQRRVANRLGRNPFSHGSPRRIEAVIENVEDRWIARLHVRDEEGRSLGTRELSSNEPECSSIQAAAVLAVALAIDPNAPMGPEPEVRGEPEAPWPAPSEPRTVAPSLPPSPSRPRAAPEPFAVEPALPADVEPKRAWNALTMRGGLALGLTPAPSGLVGMRWFAGSGPFALSVDALWVDESDTENGFFSFGLTAFGTGACYLTGSGDWVSAGVCASAWLGSTHAVVREIRATDPGARTFVATSFGAVTRALVVEPVHLEIGADMFAPLVRKRYTVTGWDEPAWEPPAVAWTLHAGLGVSFP